MSVALVIVAHSRMLADAVVEVAAQMAPNVRLIAAGGTDDDRVGTSFDKVAAALAAAVREGHEVAVLADLGSAVLTAETAVEFSEEGTVRVAYAPLVEGAVAAAVAAEIGRSLNDVIAAAEEAGGEVAEASDGHGQEVRREVTFVNEMGLHARPAAQVATNAVGFDAEVTISGADATSVLSLLALTLTKGSTAEISASGPQAQEAVDSLAQLIESGFGEA